MAAPGAWASRAACSAALLAVVALGAWWAADRARRWETPSLERASFRVVRGDGPAPAGGVWLVPVNLRCGRCREQLHAVLVSRAGGRSPQVVALIVDHDRAPRAETLADLPADQVWWDGTGTWRFRWGHRLYGEVVRFDRHGRYLGTQPPRGLGPSLASETEGR